eukprot:TRINITY_DN9582_c0_g1_i1.p1 TRINITY_DN9582_c0_g1~~TRINITY_DN9582_c0_g1_i1.p1  ORF type:complete len:370 (+),score=-64.91 TRINITY_DN9582_c0_g1_i1:416-1525(+)
MSTAAGCDVSWDHVDSGHWLEHHHHSPSRQPCHANRRKLQLQVRIPSSAACEHVDANDASHAEACDHLGDDRTFSPRATYPRGRYPAGHHHHYHHHPASRDDRHGHRPVAAASTSPPIRRPSTAAAPAAAVFPQQPQSHRSQSCLSPRPAQPRQFRRQQSCGSSSDGATHAVLVATIRSPPPGASRPHPSRPIHQVGETASRIGRAAALLHAHVDRRGPAGNATAPCSPRGHQCPKHHEVARRAVNRGQRVMRKSASMPPRRMDAESVPCCDPFPSPPSSPRPVNLSPRVKSFLRRLQSSPPSSAGCSYGGTGMFSNCGYGESSAIIWGGSSVDTSCRRGKRSPLGGSMEREGHEGVHHKLSPNNVAHL